jgi:hypothetical protein
MKESGRCSCSCADVCPLRRIGSSYRCTADELRDKLREVILNPKSIPEEDTKRLEYLLRDDD